MAISFTGKFSMRPMFDAKGEFQEWVLGQYLATDDGTEIWRPVEKENNPITLAPEAQPGAVGYQ